MINDPGSRSQMPISCSISARLCFAMADGFFDLFVATPELLLVPLQSKFTIVYNSWSQEMCKALDYLYFHW